MSAFLVLERLATLVAAIVALIGIWLLVKQLASAKSYAKGDFLLRLDERFDAHREVHRKLRPGGDWVGPGTGPQSAEDWIEVEMYMGLFERINVLVKSGVVDIRTIAKLYGYRLVNIVSNEIIRETQLEGKLAGNWTDFQELHDGVQDHLG